jgi:CRP-like cAMP-binding protein
MTTMTAKETATWGSAAHATDPRLRALRATAELAGCSDRQLRSLLPYLDEVTVPAGHQLAVEGQLCSEFLVVMWGRLRASSRQGGVRELRPGDSYGWRAMWERTPNDVTVVAESEARLLVAGHSQFRLLKSVGARPAV